MAKLMTLCKSRDNDVHRDFSTLLLTKGIAADQVEQHIAAIKKIWRAANGVPADRVAFVQEYLKRL
ncbi:MAG: hypothetical protein MJ240_13950 [Kiritimatiellae bacterium]|nr:hypothetical protein [Kiritimatiellia bacterium]